MKLYTTSTSPYGRMARIAIIEHDLSADIAVVAARTREANSPFYAINPSGRVPFLLLEDGRSFEESQLICRFLDDIGHGPALVRPASEGDWAFGRLHAQAISMLDGIAVLGRELRRPEADRSETIIAHEEDRLDRLANVWEDQIGNALLRGPLNIVQMVVVCAIDSIEFYAGRSIRNGRPHLTAWHAEMHRRASIAATIPAQQFLELNAASSGADTH